MRSHTIEQERTVRDLRPSRNRWRSVGALVDRLDAVFERRVVSRPAAIVLVELFAGLGWLRAGIEKLIDRDWWTGETIRSFVAEHRDDRLDWYGSFLDAVVEVIPLGVAVGVLAAEMVIAYCLLLGRRLPLAVGLGSALLLQFLFAGATNPAVFYLIFHGLLGIWAVEQLAPSTAVLAGVRWATLGCLAVMLASIPFARAAAPAEAIDDPALVASAWAGCLAVSLVGARRRIRRRYIEATTIDLRLRSAEHPTATISS